MVYESDIIRGYHKQDDHFNLPKMNCFVHFYSPVASGSTWGLDGSNLFAKLCDDELNEELYDADLCGLSFHLVIFSFFFCPFLLSFSFLTKKNNSLEIITQESTLNYQDLMKKCLLWRIKSLKLCSIFALLKIDLMI